MHRIQGQKRLAGPAQGDHGFQGVFLGSGLGAGTWRAFERSLWHVVMGVFFCSLQGRAGSPSKFGSRSNWKSWIRTKTERSSCRSPWPPTASSKASRPTSRASPGVSKPISHLLPTLIDVVFEQSDDTEVLVCSVSGVLKSCGWIWKPQVCGLVSTSLVNLIQPADAWWTPACRFGRFLIDEATFQFLHCAKIKVL